MSSEIRLGQLIAPFGPGSIYTDKNGVPTVICGLDYWYKKEDINGFLTESSLAIKNATIVEPRLAEFLKVSHFRQPPVNFYDRNKPEISGLKIQGHRFPRWYVNNATGQLKRFNLETSRIEKPEKGAWKPVRFIAVCQSGHMVDFPWAAWSGCICNTAIGLILNDSGGADLSSISVRCTNCNKGKSLSGATSINRNEQTSRIESTGLSNVGIECIGVRPWLGNEATHNHCESPLAAVLINQSNIYFSKTISSIFLPDVSADPDVVKINEVFTAGDASQLVLAKISLTMGITETFYSSLRSMLKGSFDQMPSDEKIKLAYDGLGKGRLSSVTTETPAFPDSELLAFRREEFNILRNEVVEGVSSELRIIPAGIPNSLQTFFSKVNLVERLRETRVFYGFERLERSDNPIDGMPNTAMDQLFLEPPSLESNWLPAVKNYGEGIYIELSEDAITKWLQTNSEWLQERYGVNFTNRMSNELLLLPPSANIDWKWAARYQMIHTLSHILINQLVFECGYSSAALKERLFVSPDLQAPMAGILIYTASGDSEGSLGGLVRQGRPQLIESMVRRAVSRASWCSADPVCSENMGGAGARLVNMAACHACTLLPETACETINNGLDRAAVVGIPNNNEVGFLSELFSNYLV
jgi:hypothetical protein